MSEERVEVTAAELIELRRRLDDQERRLAAQEAELARLRAGGTNRQAAELLAPATPPPAGGDGSLADLRPTTEAPAGTPVTDRRAVLRRFGVAAAGAVTGGAALAAATAGPAAANTGDNLIIGNASNAGNATTQLSWNGAAQTSTGPAVLMVKDVTSAQLNNTGATVLAYRLTTGGAALMGDHAGTNGTGVYGLGDYAGGVFVGSSSGYGIVAQGKTAASLDAVFAGGTGVDVSAGSNQLILRGPVADPTTTGAAREAGSVAYDLNGVLWLCISSGSPGVWRRLGGTGTTGALTVLPTPKRVFDSRAGFAPLNSAKGAFVNTTKVIDAKNNSSGVPVGATAVLVNLAVTNTNSGGYGTLWANGFADPGTASVNWGVAGTTVSNSVVSAVNSTALLNCKIAGTADVIIDVIGYYR